MSVVGTSLSSSNTEHIVLSAASNSTELISFTDKKISTPNSEIRPLLKQDSPWSYSPCSLQPMLIESVSKKRSKDEEKLPFDDKFAEDIESESDNNVVVKKSRTKL